MVPGRQHLILENPALFGPTSFLLGRLFVQIEERTDRVAERRPLVVFLRDGISPADDTSTFLNGATLGGWVRYAREMQDAGADAIELNIYFLPTNFEISGAQIEDDYCELVAAVKSHVRIPLAVKLGPFFTSIPHLARRLEQSGAGALVLFNRFYQPDFDLETLEATPNLKLSTPDELRLRLNAVALLSARLDLDLAITGGIHSAEDAIKGVLSGAHVVMLTSALLKHGIGHLREVITDMTRWMHQRDYESIHQMRGAMNVANVAEPEVFQRANYLKVLGSYAVTPS